MKNKKKTLIALWLITAIFGTFMIFSATSDSASTSSLASFKPFIKNGILIIGLYILLRVFFFNNKGFYIWVKKRSKYFFYISLILLFAVLIIGGELNNSKMVLTIGKFRFQPLELYKITAILYYSSLFNTDEYMGIWDIIKGSILPIIGIGMIAVQPDLGGAAIVAAEMIAIALISGRQTPKVLISIIVVGVIGLLLLVGMLQGYQKERFQVWLDPFSAPADEGYQPIQSYIAISNGGLRGTGYLNSSQKSFLPVSESDYIFAIICEELGIIGAIGTIVLLGSIVWVLIKIGDQGKGDYERIFPYGMALLILIQSFINIGGVVGIIPMTGVTLPFISNGTNSFIFMSLGIFYAGAIDNYNNYDRKKKKRKKRKKTNDESR